MKNLKTYKVVVTKWVPTDVEMEIECENATWAKTLAKAQAHRKSKLNPGDKLERAHGTIKVIKVKEYARSTKMTLLRLVRIKK